MEDLDEPRVVPGMADDILRTLEVLGLLWDGEIVWQSRRSEAYESALEELKRKGVVYPCGCSRAEIARAASAPHGRGEDIRYLGLCRDGLPSGKPPRSIRLRVPDKPIFFTDGVMGMETENLFESCGDFVVKRADGPYAYQLAVVVDDHDGGINQVVRGADLLHSTPRQIHIHNVLGFALPSYFHLPLVTGPCGGKLSKRDSAVSLAAGRDLKRDGGELLVAALRFLGQNPPPPLDNAPCGEVLSWGVAHFKPDSIPSRSAPFPGH
jgi:glutamyl-Q tRNA(Asp) synthetase